jgi:hypothetical protein
MLPDQIKVGSCYRTGTNNVHKVLEITADDRVNFLTRGGSYARGENAWTPGALSNAWPRCSVFALKVLSEVPCDWDPATAPAAPPAVPAAPPKPKDDMGPP